ncbi:MAG TPA: hypothetical protein VMU42_01395, partial [Candidatus Sulfotelmatobacter sp.]|nr:hypothetical protein [Candidatus Sulfotelmatobacter sp.]
MMMLRKLLLLAPLSLFCLVAVHSVRGQTPGYNYRHELLDTPVYDSASKSYFEMVDGSHGMVKGTGVDSEGPNWGEAEKFAASRVFKGVHGRLAVVKDLEIHEFLMRTFQPKTFVWFGLRYLCSKQLQDSTGALLNKNSFMAWAKQ